MLKEADEPAAGCAEVAGPSGPVEERQQQRGFQHTAFAAVAQGTVRTDPSQQVTHQAATGGAELGREQPG
jgi:hypothetical protein